MGLEKELGGVNLFCIANHSAKKLRNNGENINKRIENLINFPVSTSRARFEKLYDPFSNDLHHPDGIDIEDELNGFAFARAGASKRIERFPESLVEICAGRVRLF